MKPLSSPPAHSAVPLGGFTLVELMVVVSIIAVMMGLLVPAFSSINKGAELTRTAYDIASTLEQARAYAMANNTFVYVGIGEFDASKNPGAASQAPGNGRVALAVVASKDGTRGYDATKPSLPNPAWDSYNNGQNLVPIKNLLCFENIHLAKPGELNGFGQAAEEKRVVGSGNMSRPAIGSQLDIVTSAVGEPDSSVTQFTWPLGKPFGEGQYHFTKVINFDPQGVARIQYSTTADAIARYLEIGLLPTHGSLVPSKLPTNLAAIQIDGITGAAQVYRP